MSGLSRKDIEDIMHLLDASEFDSLKLEMGDLKLELTRRSAMAPAASAPVAVAGPASVAAPAPTEAPAAPTLAAAADGADVPAPLLGTFYRAAKPGADPFVAPGDRVEPDTVIGIIEVMKLMNSVTAGMSGTVTAVVAPDGELVEHGQCLIRVRQD